VISTLEPGGAVMMGEDTADVGLRKDSINAHATNISMGFEKIQAVGAILPKSVRLLPKFANRRPAEFPAGCGARGYVGVSE
jgi:hypothetical protein